MISSPLLFSSLQIRELKLKNRIVVSPMCQYSSAHGLPNKWHLVHLGSRATGGAGLVFCEATAISPEGRISSADTGIWNREQAEAFREITQFIKSQSCAPGIQIAHAGRKASDKAPWKLDFPVEPQRDGWRPLAPSEVPFDERSIVPKEMSTADIDTVLHQFCEAARNAIAAGFEVLEIHMAHGYLLHEFLSPLSNFRTDRFGGLIENRMRFPLMVAAEVRRIWPSSLPVFVRISVTDWVEGGWSIEDSVLFAKELDTLGIDLIDCSSGGSSPLAQIKIEPGYQVPFSERIRKEADILTGAVGLITDAHQAESILAANQADLIFIAREFLRDPYWPLHAAKSLGHDIDWPKAYGRAKS